MPAEQSTHITTYSQKSDEWWTPNWLLESARTVLWGVIDLDPASTPLANERVKAEHIFTREDNGLEQDWFGKVFLNPPSRRGDPTARPHLWAQKLIREIEKRNVHRAILVVKSVLGYKWYEELYRRYWVCHLRDRPEFVRPDGTTVGRAKKGVSVFYIEQPWDDNYWHFRTIFKPFGRVIAPEGE